jgi:dTDP-4-dehydrorhamnose reductase
MSESSTRGRACLVIGASGLVGSWLLRAAQARGWAAAGTYLSQSLAGLRGLDIRDGGQVCSLLAELHPEVVFLPAARANVDHCELHPAEVYPTNVSGVRNVVGASNEVGAKLVYFSSDYVFDGTSGPYAEEEAPNPINQYGIQKVLAEHYVALHARDYLIVRTTVVYGAETAGKNFVYRLHRTLAAGETLTVPMDQVGSPTYAPDLAHAAIELAGLDARGLYHLVGPTQVDRYRFACEAAEQLQLDAALIRPVTTTELGQPARRPLRAGLLCDKALRVMTTRLRDHTEGLRALAGEIR